MLGGVILVIVAVLFVGVRACVGSGKGTSDGEQTTAQDNDQGNERPYTLRGVLSR